MRKLITLIALLGIAHGGWSQDVVADTVFKPGDVHKSDWNNYSTTYIPDCKWPYVVAAIPWNGVEENTSNTPYDVAFGDYRYRSQLSARGHQLYTYELSPVYFFVPNLFDGFGKMFEYRVVKNDKEVLTDWGPITHYRWDKINLGTTFPTYGFLGGYSTGFGNTISVELRQKGTDSLFARSQVRWVSTRPLLASVFTNRGFIERTLNYSEDQTIGDLLNVPEAGDNKKFDTGSKVPTTWILPAGETGLVFQVRTRIYQPGVLEWRVLREGQALADWKGNVSVNRYVRVDSLSPGHYTLELRYRKNRGNVTTYPFTVEAAWYQTWAFKITAGILAVATLGFLVLAFKLRRQRRTLQAEQAKKERLELGLRSVYAQLNPHFTFNALSSIQGLINSQDFKGANHYLSAFAQLVRRSLADSEQKFIPLQQELQTLDIYLGLEKLRFNFTYSIQWPDGFPVATAEVPSLLLQPLVENAVKHGISSLHDKGKIEVAVQAKGADMLIKVTDNGGGFDPSQVKSGYGLQLTRDRIRLFNEMAGHEQIILRIDTAPASGTIIELLFKNWLV